jgi:hypothetical protein
VGAIDALAESSAALRANCRLDIPLFLGSFITSSPCNAQIPQFQRLPRLLNSAKVVNWPLEHFVRWFFWLGCVLLIHLRECSYVELECLIVLTFELQLGLQLFHEDFEA